MHEVDVDIVDVHWEDNCSGVYPKDKGSEVGTNSDADEASTMCCSAHADEDVCNIMEKCNDCAYGEQVTNNESNVEAAGCEVMYHKLFVVTIAYSEELVVNKVVKVIAKCEENVAHHTWRHLLKA